jgi:hypothetical protein
VHRAMSPQPSRVRMEEGWTEQHEQAFPLTSADLLMEELDKHNWQRKFETCPVWGAKYSRGSTIYTDYLLQTRLNWKVQIAQLGTCQSTQNLFGFYGDYYGDPAHRRGGFDC